MSNTDQFCEYANEAVLSANYAKANEAEDRLLEFEHLPHSAESSLLIKFDGQKLRTVESCERELVRRRRTEIQLRDALVREEALLHQKDELIRQMVVLRQESDHRLLNGAQMIVSLLSLQSRTSKNAEVASQLAAAADRITTMCRIHQHLHAFNGAPTVAIKEYLEELCRDFSRMWSVGGLERVIVVEGIEIDLPAATAIPLGFIANELITNAAKYGAGRITLNLESNPQKGYLLSVSDDGPGLPEGFDPTGSKGLGMRIIRSFVDQIGGELQIGRSDINQGTKFTVLFLRAACDPIPAVIKASAISDWPEADMQQPTINVRLPV
jgi:two-component sensor histidine kinase